jgi:hypothetical protein
VEINAYYLIVWWYFIDVFKSGIIDETLIGIGCWDGGLLKCG